MALTTTISCSDFISRESNTIQSKKRITQQANGAKPLAKRWDHRYSDESLCMTVSPLKETANALDITKTTPLGAARPYREYYPWKSITLSATEEAAAGFIEPITYSKGTAPFDLSDALNYGFTAGPTELLDFFTSHVEKVHSPQYKDWKTCLTCGTTAGIDLTFRMLCNRGDWILAEEFTYSGTLLAAKSHGINVASIKMDQMGLDPEDLDQTLINWDSTRGKKPFVLYTIPSGQNPTGITQPNERRRKIYEIAQKHDLYIMEDDPYYYLQLPDSGVTFADSEEYIKSLPDSYLSLDTSGRVLRLDSVSKILAPGMRAGWVTGSAQIIELYVAFADLSTLCPSGPTQVMLYQLFRETWGQDGFIKWLIHLSSQYQNRRDVALRACDQYLPRAVCAWNSPKIGMFIYVRVNLKQHPLWEEQKSTCGGSKFHTIVEDRISDAAEAKNVLVAKGSWFAVENHQETLFFRLTFAAAPQENLEQAFRKFGDVIACEFRITS